MADQAPPVQQEQPAGSSPDSQVPQAPLSPPQQPQPSEDLINNYPQGAGQAVDEDTYLTPQQITSSKSTIPVIPILLIAVVVVVGLLAFTFFGGHILKPTTTTTTTIIISKESPITGCGAIAKPGYYFLPSSIKTAIQGGSCINVTVSNVNITCGGNKIVGSGPFLIVPPFTTGVSVVNEINVTVSQCNIENFSYGIFVQSSNQININNNNVSLNYMSNVDLNNTYNSLVNENYMSESSSPSGSLSVTNNTKNTLIINNTLQYNLYYDININSSNNTYQNNFMSSSPYSFRCSVPNGFVTSSKAIGNTCYNSSGCGFVQCLDINLPTNISKLTLQSTVRSCGSIVSPGTYQLVSDLNMKDFVNISNIVSVLEPCIRVASKNVVLNCDGRTISNSSVAISTSGGSNITIEDCKVTSTDIGLLLSNTTLSYLSNISISGASYGVEMLNSSLTSLSNISSSRSTYGIFLSSSYSNIFQSLNVTGNTYGVYLKNSSYSNTFSKGAVTNSTKVDVFATADSAAPSYDLMLSVDCGYSNAQWASCKHFLKPSLSFIPVSGCGAISAPGNYLLQSGIANGSNNCIKIDSSNVKFSCGNLPIYPNTTSYGSAVYISNETNVSINLCKIINFPFAVNVSDSSLVTINGIFAQSSQYGIILTGVTNSTLSNNKVNSSTKASIALYNTTRTLLLKNMITYGYSNNYGIILNNSQNNTVLGNSGSHNYIGMLLIGNSRNNTVINNTMQINTGFDYACINNDGLAAENGGINYGTTKLGCNWLAAITVTSPQVSCTIASQPSLFLLTSDYEYTTGSTCFSVFANSTTINCNGHTVIATNGGTFANFLGAKSAVLQDCYLKGFTNTIIVNKSTINIFNNSVLESPSPQGTAINIKATGYGTYIHYNNLSAPYIGISLFDTDGGKVQSNLVYGGSVAYSLSNVTGLSVTNNTALPTTGTGILLNKSVANIFNNNNFESTTGMLCQSTSQGMANNTDSGGNRCSTNTNCSWSNSC